MTELMRWWPNNSLQPTSPSSLRSSRAAAEIRRSDESRGILIDFSTGHLHEAIYHSNEAIDRLDTNSAAVDVADVIFRRLNKLQTVRPTGDGDTPKCGTASFVELVNLATPAGDVLAGDAGACFCGSGRG